MLIDGIIALVDANGLYRGIIWRMGFHIFSQSYHVWNVASVKIYDCTATIVIHNFFCRRIKYFNVADF